MGLLRRHCFPVLALLVALLQVAQPVLGYAWMAAQGTLTQEICTSTGFVRVPVGGAGADFGSRQPTTDDSHCQICTAGGALLFAALPPVADAPHEPAPLPRRTGLAPDTAPIAPRATGPPALV